MKSEELIKLKEKVQEIKQKRDKVLEIQEEIKKLEECEEVKKYIKLLSVYEEMIPEKSKKIAEYTEKDIINIALGYTKITPSEDIYVYIGTYKNSDEFDIVHGPSDILVSKNNKDADYILYQNLEAKYGGTVQVPYKKADEFESNHKVIFPQNVVSRQRYFYDLQLEYFKTMIFESPEKAEEKINSLIRK